MAVELGQFLYSQIEKLERTTPEHPDLPYLRRLYAENEKYMRFIQLTPQARITEAESLLQRLIEEDVGVQAKSYIEKFSPYDRAKYEEAVAEFGDDCVYHLIPPYASKATSIFHILSRNNIRSKQQLVERAPEDIKKFRNNGDVTQKWIFAIRDIALESPL